MGNEHVELVEMARRQGNAANLPKPPAGLPDGGGYVLEKSKRADGSVRVTLTYNTVDGRRNKIGWYVLDASTSAPSVNGTGPKGKPQAPRQPEPVGGGVETLRGGVETLRATSLREPAPLILIEPGLDGTRFNAYGLELPEVIEELRRALVHLVATSAGMEVISTTVPRDAAVMVERLPVRPQPKQRAAKGKLKRTVSYGDLDDDDLDETEEDDRW